MSDEIIIRYCAPTLAGIKTGNLFSFPYKSELETDTDLKQLNQILLPKGLQAVALGKKKNRTLILIYRKCYLERDLTSVSARQILQERQYPDDIDSCINHLGQRLKTCSEFPHEIGLFLGYPTEDIIGFICNKASNSKYTGTWKVYGDVAKAKKSFEQFEKCTDIYYKVFKKGLPLERLVVAV